MRPPQPNAPGQLAAIDEALIESVVVTFYGKVRADAALGPMFEARIHDWPEHLQTLSRFWSSLLLMTGRYKGTPLQHHLTLPGLTERHFGIWLGHFRVTLAELCTPEQSELFMSRAERVARSFQMAMAQRDGEGPLLCPVIRPQTAVSPISKPEIRKQESQQEDRS